MTLNSLAAGAILLAAAGFDASAGRPPCGPHDDMVRETGTVVAQGITELGELLEVVIDRAGGFTILLTPSRTFQIRTQQGVWVFPAGTACIEFYGDGWQAVEREP